MPRELPIRTIRVVIGMRVHMVIAAGAVANVRGPPDARLRASAAAGEYPGILTVVKVDKMSVSFEATLGNETRRTAREDSDGLSSWPAEAAARKLRADALREFLDEWEAEFGAVTSEELARAEADLGLGAGEPEA